MRIRRHSAPASSSRPGRSETALLSRPGCRGSRTTCLKGALMEEPSREAPGGAGVDLVIGDEALRRRVREVIGEPVAPKGWGRVANNPMAKLLIGFLLTGVLGTWISSCYQSQRAWHDAAAGVTDSVGTVLNVGLMLGTRFYDAVNT